MSSIRQPRYKQIYAKAVSGDEMAVYAAEKWAEVKMHLVENDLVSKPRLGMADRYVRACTDYEFLYRQVVEDGPVKVSAQTGGEYFNYLWSACEKLNDRILKMEASLLISPQAAEGKLAVKPKAVKAPAGKYLGKNKAA